MITEERKAEIVRMTTQEKVEDIVGLYLNPPEHAVVFSVDEKSQIQALDRTQPGLLLKKGGNACVPSGP